MSRKKNPPPHCDLNFPSWRIAAAHAVSVSTVHRWKREAGILMKRGVQRQMRGASAALLAALTPEDWEKGYKHVGAMLGVSALSARNMHHRILGKPGKTVTGTPPKPGITTYSGE